MVISNKDGDEDSFVVVVDEAVCTCNVTLGIVVKYIIVRGLLPRIPVTHKVSYNLRFPARRSGTVGAGNGDDARGLSGRPRQVYVYICSGFWVDRDVYPTKMQYGCYRLA